MKEESIDSLISTIKEEEGYPVGLKVLVVDEDPWFLQELDAMLQKCNYKCKRLYLILQSLITKLHRLLHSELTNLIYASGTMCCSASQALSVLQDKSLKFDIILLAIVSDMDGFKKIQQFVWKQTFLLATTSMYNAETVNELVGANGSKLLKPVRFRDAQCIWFPVAGKRKQNIRKLVKEDMIDGWEGSVITKLLYSRWGDDGCFRKLIKLIQKVEEEEKESMNLKAEEHDNSLYPNKKPKIQQGEDYMDVTVEKHHASLFLNSKLKIPWMVQNSMNKADPAEILERMSSPAGLTRKDVAIHLMEFRFLREAFAAGHPSTMPFNEKAKPLWCSLRGYTDDVNIWRMYCGSFYA
ncbi:hypothetical protein MKW94_007423 [Papaver nudicaule]|uniref:Response regulatory domain-containing protein n=1 Tax=Papaver nudicaule TaxID=74823 RepID=A0AA41VM00_PAPNU|nr:hypothetical protein [Papaver nudicaule]